jgi:hypothetical protein
MTATDITKDAAYDAVAPDDFEAMLVLDRYNNRSTAFDRIISATDDHFWDPLDRRYIDFDEPFDMEGTPLVPEWLIASLSTDYVSGHLSDPAIRTRFINSAVHYGLSSILHGEQGALNLSASLCHVLRDQGAQEYAANQTREEARHVTAFARYIRSRWGEPKPCGPVLKDLLVDIIAGPEVYKKIIGMQMLVEGLAMGAFATYYQNIADPVAKRLMQLVMTDEAFHHKFGKIWADKTIPKLSAEEHAIVEDWAAECFQHLLFNLVSPSQMEPLYREFGLDPDQVMAAFRELMTDDKRRQNLTKASNIFRVLVKTLLNAGIITDRTRPFYAYYIDMDELKAEGDRMIGDDIAEDGIRYLQAINFKERARPVTIAAE